MKVYLQILMIIYFILGIPFLIIGWVYGFIKLNIEAGAFYGYEIPNIIEEKVEAIDEYLEEAVKQEIEKHIDL